MTHVLALIMPFTSVIQQTTQVLAATQKAQFHELWEPLGFLEIPAHPQRFTFS